MDPDYTVVVTVVVVDTTGAAVSQEGPAAEMIGQAFVLDPDDFDLQALPQQGWFEVTLTGQVWPDTKMDGQRWITVGGRGEVFLFVD